MIDAVPRILLLLFQAFLVCIVYFVAKYHASKSKCHKAKAFLWAIGVSAFLAGICWANYGTHIVDTRRGGKIIVDFKPTKAERNRLGALTFILIAAPSMVGTYRGLKKRKIHEE